MVNSFFSSNRYFDNKNCPRGFSRCGYFTIREAQLLERYGHAYNELNNGKRQPITEDERKFVEVCRGNLDPSNEHEKVWFKYIKYTRSPKKFHTLSKGRPQLDIIEENIDVDNED